MRRSLGPRPRTIAAGLWSPRAYNSDRCQITSRSPLFVHEEANVPTLKQTTVHLENNPGRLAQVLSALAQAKVNVVALAVMDRQDRSVLRLVTENEAATRKALADLNLQATENDVLAVELRNQPGALSRVCEQLAAGHINIDYAYCSSGGRNGR